MSALTAIAPTPGDGEGFIATCVEHGDVTSVESGFTADRGVSLEQASLYRQRHLAKHLASLADEMVEAAR